MAIDELKKVNVDGPCSIDMVNTTTGNRVPFVIEGYSHGKIWVGPGQKFDKVIENTLSDVAATIRVYPYDIDFMDLSIKDTPYFNSQAGAATNTRTITEADYPIPEGCQSMIVTVSSGADGFTNVGFGPATGEYIFNLSSSFVILQIPISNSYALTLTDFDSEGVAENNQTDTVRIRFCRDIQPAEILLHDLSVTHTTDLAQSATDIMPPCPLLFSGARALTAQWQGDWEDDAGATVTFRLRSYIADPATIIQEAAWLTVDSATGTDMGAYDSARTSGINLLVPGLTMYQTWTNNDAVKDIVNRRTLITAHSRANL